MSLFQYAKTFIESQIFSYKTFLLEHIGDHELPNADISMLQEWIEKLKATMKQDIGKTLEDAVKTVVVPNWKTIFEADNYIDTGKTVEEQRTILKSILDSLHETGFVNNEYLPDHIVEIVNRDFLKDSEYKTQILIEELTAEYNLCDSSISWIDALAERIRVMYYSGLLVGDMDGIETLLVRFQPTMFESVLNTDDFTAWKNAFFNTTGRSDEKHPIENILTPADITTMMSLLKDKPTRKLNVMDLAMSIALICVGVAPSDDWMDLEEDVQNNKITGITRALQSDIQPRHILSTTILYLRSKIEAESAFRNIELWYVELMTLMYQDLPACLAFCKNTSPYMFESIFQRK